MQKLRISVGGWMGISSLVVIVLIVWLSSLATTQKLRRQEALSSREAALLCTTDMATKYHIHPELQIIVDGVQVQIPAEIGVGQTCMNSIHTHDATGVIHVESPVTKDFTLGDFFAVWKKDFSKEKLFDYSATKEGSITVTLNGQKVDTYEHTILRDKDKIVITYSSK